MHKRHVISGLSCFALSLGMSAAAVAAPFSTTTYSLEFRGFIADSSNAAQAFFEQYTALNPTLTLRTFTDLGTAGTPSADLPGATTYENAAEFSLVALERPGVYRVISGRPSDGGRSLIEVGNDLPATSPSAPPIDSFFLDASTNSGTSNPLIFLTDGVPSGAGIATVQVDLFNDTGTALSDSSLPVSLAISDFQSPDGFNTVNFLNAADSVRYTVTNIADTPTLVLGEGPRNVLDEFEMGQPVPDSPSLLSNGANTRAFDPSLFPGISSDVTGQTEDFALPEGTEARVIQIDEGANAAFLELNSFANFTELLLPSGAEGDVYHLTFFDPNGGIVAQVNLAPGAPLVLGDLGQTPPISSLLIEGINALPNAAGEGLPIAFSYIGFGTDLALSFSALTIPVEVLEPAALLLFASGLCGLGLRRRKG